MELISEVDPLDTGSLIDRVEMYRLLADANADQQHLATMTETCVEACRQVKERIKQQRRDHKAELAALASLVHEALASLAGTEKGFHTNFRSSMDRMDALAGIDDVRQLKAQLVREVALVRRLAVDRQKAWEKTCQGLTDRVQTLEKRLSEAAAIATTDALTQLTSRGAFEAICREWLSTPDKQFVMAMLDVDNLKSLNDTYGHQAGDRAIVTVATALRQSFRMNVDVVARYGGDEFVLLVHGLEFRQVEQRLKMLVSSLAAAPMETSDGASVKLTVSCGMAEYTAGDTLESLVERADAALYEAKRGGRDRIMKKEKPTLRMLLRH